MGFRTVAWWGIELVALWDIDLVAETAAVLADSRVDWWVVSMAH